MSLQLQRVKPRQSYRVYSMWDLDQAVPEASLHELISLLFRLSQFES